MVFRGNPSHYRLLDGWKALSLRKHSDSAVRSAEPRLDWRQRPLSFTTELRKPKEVRAAKHGRILAARWLADARNPWMC